MAVERARVSVHDFAGVLELALQRGRNLVRRRRDAQRVRERGRGARGRAEALEPAALREQCRQEIGIERERCLDGFALRGRIAEMLRCARNTLQAATST